MNALIEVSLVVSALSWHSFSGFIRETCDVDVLAESGGVFLNWD